MSDPRAAIERLLGLGLADDWGEIDSVAHAAANPLARPLAGSGLTDEEQEYLAAAGDFPVDPRGVEAAWLALDGSAPADVLEQAAFAAGAFLFGREHDAKAALAILEPARAKIDADNKVPGPNFLLLASNCAERIGEIALQIDLLERGLALRSDDKVALAQIASAHASATISRDGPGKALQTLRDAVLLFEEAKEERSRAATMDRIADILEQRGETEEALRIHIEERLPIATATKDLDMIGHVRFSCAHLRIVRGGLEQGEAQTIYEELTESFEIYQRLQRVDGVAAVGLALGQVLAMGRHPDEALTVLDDSATAFEKLQRTQEAKDVRELQQRIREESQ